MKPKIYKYKDNKTRKQKTTIIRKVKSMTVEGFLKLLERGKPNAG